MNEPFKLSITTDGQSNPVVWRTTMHVVGADSASRGLKLWCSCGWRTPTIDWSPDDHWGADVTHETIERAALRWGEHLNLSMWIYSVRRGQHRAERRAAKAAAESVNADE